MAKWNIKTNLFLLTIHSFIEYLIFVLCLVCNRPCCVVWSKTVQRNVKNVTGYIVFTV